MMASMLSRRERRRRTSRAFHAPPSEVQGGLYASRLLMLAGFTVLSGIDELCGIAKVCHPPQEEPDHQRSVALDAIFSIEAVQ